MRLLLLLLLTWYGCSYEEDEYMVEEDGEVLPLPPRSASTPQVTARRAARAAAPTPAAAAPPPEAASAAAPGSDFSLPAGRVFEFPLSVRPNGLALVPSRNAFVVTDGAVHGDKYYIPQVRELMGWWEWALWSLGLGAEGPYPFAYLVSTEGELIRTLEFVDREALARGAAESLDSHLAFTFYQGPGLEVWDPTLDVKMTYHELGSKPSSPVYDTDGLLWLPYTVGDRHGEEGDGAVVLWAYRRDGTPWEVVHRRQVLEAYPSALHFDASGRLALAGLASWVFSDGMYGQELSVEGEGGEEALRAPGAAPCRLSFYTLSGERRRAEFGAEQRARWAAATGASPPPGEAEASQPLSAVPLLEATFDFPFPACLHALFVLTGDGHAVTACRGSGSLRIVRLGYPVGAGGGGGSSGAGAPPRETARAAAAAASLPGRKVLREAWGPPLAPPTAAAIRLLPSNASQLRADLAHPYGIVEVGGLAMHPSGTSFAVLDSGSSPARMLVLPWPWEELLEEEGPLGAAPVDAHMVLTEAPPLPEGLLTVIPEPPRSS